MSTTRIETRKSPNTLAFRPAWRASAHGQRARSQVTARSRKPTKESPVQRTGPLRRCGGQVDGRASRSRPTRRIFGVASATRKAGGREEEDHQTDQRDGLKQRVRSFWAIQDASARGWKPDLPNCSQEARSPRIEATVALSEPRGAQASRGDVDADRGSPRCDVRRCCYS